VFNLWQDVYSQVLKQATAWMFATAAAFWSGFLAPIVWAGTYFILSWIESNLNRFRVLQRKRARTFYPAGSSFKGPTSLNDKRATDVDKEGLVAVIEGHPGAYYSTVHGGEPGNMYTANIITSPPAAWRAVDWITEEEAAQRQREEDMWGWETYTGIPLFDFFLNIIFRNPGGAVIELQYFEEKIMNYFKIKNKNGKPIS